MKTKLNETIDLMKRMNLFEGSSKPRIQVSRDEIIDKLEDQSNDAAGTWVSLMYVTVKPVYNTKKNWRKEDVDKVLGNYEEKGNEHWFGAVKSFNDDMEGKVKKLPMNKSIVVVRKYNLNWPTTKSFKKAYGEYDDALTNLRLKHGLLQKFGDNHNQREKLMYGDNLQQNQTGNLSKDFNFKNVRSTTTTCYVIDDNGHILGVFPEEMLKAMTAAPSSGPERYASDNLSPEELQAYYEAKKELDETFSAKNLLFDRILAIVASVNGVNYYYINDAVKHEISKGSGVYVNSQDLTKIAKDALSSAIGDVDPDV